jgi:hypothetical protein
MDTSVDVDWHPLADHCADVAAVTEALRSLGVCQQRTGCLAGREQDAAERILSEPQAEAGT